MKVETQNTVVTVHTGGVPRKRHFEEPKLEAGDRSVHGNYGCRLLEAPFTSLKLEYVWATPREGASHYVHHVEKHERSQQAVLEVRDIYENFRAKSLQLNVTTTMSPLTPVNGALYRAFVLIQPGGGEREREERDHVQGTVRVCYCCVRNVVYSTHLLCSFLYW